MASLGHNELTVDVCSISTLTFPWPICFEKTLAVFTETIFISDSQHATLLEPGNNILHFYTVTTVLN